jgi:PAS domain S-box-containing protein
MELADRKRSGLQEGSRVVRASEAPPGAARARGLTAGRADRASGNRTPRGGPGSPQGTSIRRPGAGAAAEIEAGSSAQHRGTPPRGDPAPRRARILVVEDEAIVAKDIETCVARLGYEFAGRARSAAEAIRQAIERKPDLVLMDIRLEGSLDGVFAAQEIRRHADDVAVVYLTAYADDDTLQRAKITEPFGYILKPFDERELRTTIEMALYKHRMERRLRESERWLGATLRSIGDAVIAADGSGRVVFMNAAAEELIGWIAREAAGRSLSEVLRVRDDAPDPVVRALSEDGAVIREDTVVIARGRGPTPVEAIAAPIRDEGGRGAGIVVALRDATERRRLEEQKSALLEREREANRLKDEFLAMLSHELRTPLSSILGWAQLLGAGDLDEDAVERAFATIQRNAMRQLELIDELLDVARISTGQLWLAPRAILLAPLVESALDMVRPAAAAKSVRVAFAPEPCGSVRGDPGRLLQVIANLLSNAVKFTPAGGAVDVRLRPVDGHAELTVRDTGEGIRSDFLPHLFERFRQEDSSNTRTHGGVGLGLALVRQLVELHAGTIEARSDGKNRGSTFTVRLPLTASELEPDADPPAPRGAGVRLDDVRVLLVDDDADWRAVASSMLEAHGARVVAVASAEEALGFLRGEGADVLLADLQMPGQDGYSLIRSVRGLPAAQGGAVPAAALTALARREDVGAALAAGFQMHVAKPVDAASLATAVAELAGRRDAAPG